MLKISRNTLGEYNRSCSCPHQEPREIGFAFFCFSYDFLENLQDSANWVYYWSYSFSIRPLELSAGSQPCPYFTVKTSESYLTSQCSPWGGGRHGWRNSGEAGGLGRAGAGAGWSWGSLGSISTGGWGGGGAGGVAQWRRPLPAAVCPAPASLRPGHANGQCGRLQQGLGVVPGRLHGRGG
jgi:hypothetical protein